jgi:7-cyano-7-deazaguanine synthase
VKEGKRAVILLSGGIDSSTTLAIAKSEGFELNALSFDYNQRHKRELESARMIASALGVKKHLLIKFDLREIGGSALLNDTEIRRHGDTEIVDIPPTYVPARNTIFLSFGLCWSEILEAEDIFIGANAIDYSGYPDCRPEYLRAFEEMANLATKASVEGRLRYMVHAPLISMKKSEIIKRGIELGLDYSLTWSCYDPQPAISPLPPFIKEGYGGINSYVPCGSCDSCKFRAKGFEEAGIRDPLIKS